MRRLLVRIGSPVFRLLFPYKVIGRENIPSEPGRYLLCCNHISLADPAYLMASYPEHIYFMAKAELFRHKLLGWVIGKLGALPDERATGGASANETAKTIVRDGKTMGIFPEGTRSKTGELLRFKSGTALIAAQTGATVVPACVVTKNQKVKPFRRAYILYGEPLTPEQLHLTGEQPDLRYATRLLMERIAALKEAAPR